MKTPGYIKALVQPTTQKPAARKVWSVGLEEVWLPFFTATNVLGTTRISKEALGAPLRLQREKDGTPRFSQNGKPAIRVNAELNTQIRFVRENMVMSWMNFAGNVQEAHPEEYKAEVEACQKAGRPIIEKDATDIEAAIVEAEKKARLAAEMEKAAADAMDNADKTEEKELVGASA
jgi:hypothetical protein